MTELLSTFGSLAFIAMVVIIFIMGREFLKLQKENKELHRDLDAIMNIMPNVNPEELEKIKEQFIEMEEKNTCQKS